jgi:hypothetical protein
MYSMSLALTTAGVLFGLEALERRHWPWAVAYILAASLALHTHYFAAFVLLALNLSVLVWTALGQRLRPMLVQWLLWQVIVAALYLPWLLRAGAILSGYRGNGDSPGLFEALRRALAVFAAGESASPDLGGWWAALAALLLLIGVVRLALGSAEQRRALLLLALYLCLPLLATWWSAQARPIFNERYLVAALPPFYLLLAAACAPLQSRSQSQSPGALPRTWQRAVQGLAGALAAVLLVGMGLSLASAFHDPAYSKTRGWRELSEVIEELSAGLQPERVRVAQNFPDPTLWYYYRGPVEHLVLPPQANDAAGARAVAQSLAQQGIERVILPIQPAANWDAEGLATMALDGWYDRAAQTQEGVWPLQVYAQPSSALIPVNASFGDDFTLRGFTAAPDTLPPGGLLTVHVDWAAGAAPATTGGETNTTPSTTADADLDAGADAGLVAGAGLAAVGERKVFVQLLDSEGQLVAQDDRPLVLTGPRAAGTGLAVYGLRLPPTLDSGPYRLIAGIYDPAQPGAPRLPTADGADHVVLREY